MSRTLRAALRAAAVGCAGALAMAAAGIAGAAGAATDGLPVCTATTVNVTLGSGTAQMWGDLCLPAGRHPSTVAVLVHGATYNHNYWEFPYDPDKYSFSRMLNRGGYATFAVDRMGTGGSTIPPSSELTLTAEAGQIHQVVQSLRTGQIGGHAFGKVVLGGYSLGSAITNLEASTYQDVDAELVTSLGHHFNPAGQQAIADAGQDPNTDPVLGGKATYDSGYATTKPGSRKSVFYANQPMDPGVLATDELTKDVDAYAEAYDPLIIDPTVTQHISVPVLFAFGDHDPLMCGAGYEDCTSAAALRAQELPDWTSAPSFDVILLAGAGHGLNLVPNTGVYQAASLAWLNRVVGHG